MSVKQILVIDDEEVIQEVLKACLEDLACWQVLSALSGQRGIELAIEKLPDAILLDLSMPEMSGLETLKHLRSNPSTQTIPIALLTASTHNQAEYSEFGIIGFISKPFAPTTLIERISEIFGW
jgi:CheY-like chemotaxis protein